MTHIETQINNIKQLELLVALKRAITTHIHVQVANKTHPFFNVIKKVARNAKAELSTMVQASIFDVGSKRVTSNDANVIFSEIEKLARDFKHGAIVELQLTMEHLDLLLAKLPSRRKVVKDASVDTAMFGDRIAALRAAGLAQHTYLVSCKGEKNEDGSAKFALQHRIALRQAAQKACVKLGRIAQEAPMTISEWHDLHQAVEMLATKFTSAADIEAKLDRAYVENTSTRTAKNS